MSHVQPESIQAYTINALSWVHVVNAVSKTHATPMACWHMMQVRCCEAAPRPSARLKRLFAWVLFQTPVASSSRH